VSRPEGLHYAGLKKRYRPKREGILKKLGRLSLVAMLMVGSALAIDLSAQARGSSHGGGGSSTSRIASPSVVASWMSHENYADGKITTLLVLWRGSVGWFLKGGSGVGSGGGSGSGTSGSWAYEYVSQGGLTFMMGFDYDKRVVKLVNEEISLDTSNVVLVDFVDSANGPTIVGSRWVERPAPAQTSAPDPIAAVIKSSVELYEYLRCDAEISDPVLKAMMPIICGQMRP
jgi:hypothetical protein